MRWVSKIFLILGFVGVTSVPIKGYADTLQQQYTHYGVTAYFSATEIVSSLDRFLECMGEAERDAVAELVNRIKSRAHKLQKFAREAILCFEDETALKIQCTMSQGVLSGIRVEMYRLRKHVEGAVVEDLASLELDRVEEMLETVRDSFEGLNQIDNVGETRGGDQ